VLFKSYAHPGCRMMCFKATWSHSAVLKKWKNLSVYHIKHNRFNKRFNEPLSSQF